MPSRHALICVQHKCALENLHQAIHNRSKLETVQMPIAVKWINEYWMFTQWSVRKQWELQLHATIWMSLILKHKRAQISYAVISQISLVGRGRSFWKGARLWEREGKVGRRGEDLWHAGTLLFLNLSIKVLVTWLCKFTELYTQKLLSLYFIYQ